MNKKDIDLFNKAIHNVKKTILKIEKERKIYHQKLEDLIQEIMEIKSTHNEKMQDFIIDSKETLNEMLELFEDLYEEEKK